MTRIGYHCSHEQFAPGDLLRYVRMAEEAGFASAMCSDHFHPWNERQGQSGFAWSWLGAALQATSLSFGVVTVPGGWRYHPAIIAQAAATLTAMFPGRFWIAPGSGEALNEHVTGERWPGKAERNARLREAVEIIRALWAGETVTRDGLIRVEQAARFIRPDDLEGKIRISADPERHAEWLRGDLEMGFAEINLHNVNREQERFVEAFGEHVLPEVASTNAPIRAGPRVNG